RIQVVRDRLPTTTPDQSQGSGMRVKIEPLDQRCLWRSARMVQDNWQLTGDTSNRDAGLRLDLREDQASEETPPCIPLLCPNLIHIPNPHGMQDSARVSLAPSCRVVRG